MISTKITLAIFISIVLMSLIGISYAENKTMNATNISDSKNISQNLTEHANTNQTSVNKTNTTKNLDNSESTGGIKNFMKNFKYQSSV
ncbi:hypothetical protein [Methanospirillum lacunae]|uniref:Uncharacterized protein n=1 Tax=Methanospirillum lacunae TaxID=668570 RepID=A0A2V2MZR5_9EURY|nr:hypothetical protein [Methanospirillum lacunae]PWR69798.1 hypothetical protein DK846_16615 [Methanospirillum lacunae]